MKGRILVACEFSGIVRDAFTNRGFNAISVDILDSESPGEHYKGDIFDFLKSDSEFDCFIGHPPCTYLSNSGVRWLYNSDKSKNAERWLKMRKGAIFFRNLLDYFPEIPTCIENPVIHKHAKSIIGKSHSQTIQPYQFGHGETKRTCLWLRGLPLLVPSDEVEGRETRVWSMPPGPNRKKERSRFFSGIAEAMAGQWENAILNNIELRKNKKQITNV